MLWDKIMPFAYTWSTCSSFLTLKSPWDQACLQCGVIFSPQMMGCCCSRHLSNGQWDDETNTCLFADGALHCSVRFVLNSHEWLGSSAGKNIDLKTFSSSTPIRFLDLAGHSKAQKGEDFNIANVLGLLTCHFSALKEVFCNTEMKRFT